MTTETSERIEEFWNWIEDVMAEQNTTWHAIEQRAGVANAAVWKRAHHRLPPTATTYEALAEGLNIPKARLMERGGDLEPATAQQETALDRLHAMVRRLTPEEAQEAIRFLRFWLPERFDND